MRWAWPVRQPCSRRVWSRGLQGTAVEVLTEALRRCPPSAHGNRCRLLKYLVPTQLLLGAMAPDHLAAAPVCSDFTVPAVAGARCMQYVAEAACVTSVACTRTWWFAGCRGAERCGRRCVAGRLPRDGLLRAHGLQHYEPIVRAVQTGAAQELELALQVGQRRFIFDVGALSASAYRDTPPPPPRLERGEGMVTSGDVHLPAERLQLAICTLHSTAQAAGFASPTSTA